jgi:hypothetical protein
LVSAPGRIDLAAAMCSYGDHIVESEPFDPHSKTPFEKPFEFGRLKRFLSLSP